MKRHLVIILCMDASSAFAPTLRAAPKQLNAPNSHFLPHKQRAMALYSTAEQSNTSTKKSKSKQDKHDWIEADLVSKLETLTPGFNHVQQDMEPSDEHFVLTSKYEAEKDSSLNMLSSEVSIWKNLRTSSDNDVGLPLDIMLQRTWDTVEDIWQHMRRIPLEKGWNELSSESESTRKTVVVLGSGWASHALLKVADCQKLRLIVISPSNHFVFTPMLASAAVGTVEYRSMTEAVRAANPLIDQYIEGKAVGVNVREKYVDVQLNSLLDGLREGAPPTIRIEYDHLVCSVGSRVDDRGIPGANKALRLKSCEDARRLRTAVGECLEYASRPDCKEDFDERTKRATFLIVGGGPTGVELAGELYDLFQDVTRKHKGTYPNLLGNTRVILAHGGPDLVPQFEPALRKEALRSLENKGIEVMLNTRVQELGDGFARLSTKMVDPVTGESLDEIEESILPLGLAVWCAGTAPVPFVSDLLSQLPEDAKYKDGRVKVDRWFRAPMKDESLLGSVFVLGDAAAFDENGALLPATAQVAGQAGAYTARLLNRGFNLETTPPLLPCIDPEQEDPCDVFYDPLLNRWLKFRGFDFSPPFRFLNLGMLAYTGGGEALSQVQLGDVPVLSVAGSVSYLLWRSVYLVKQVATRNRILVTFDWWKSKLFGRDITRL